jgi:hypothetical protein
VFLKKIHQISREKQTGGIMAKGANEQLFEFLETAEPGTIWSILKTMDTVWQFEIDWIKEKIRDISTVPKCATKERHEL